MAAVPFASASAVAFSGSETATDYYTGTNLGLTINVTQDNPTFGFSLASVNDTTTIGDLFSLSTPESSVDLDDLIGHQINVNFTFTSPTSGTGGVGGTTVGYGLIGLFGKGGSITWNDPGSITFSNGAELRVSLLPLTGTFGLDGKRPLEVGAKFTLLDPGAPVPEPASWAMMIGGFGLIGGALRRTRTIALA